MPFTQVYIKDLRLHAYHGVLEQERSVGNDYVVNISVGYPWEEAMLTDNVSDTLNYAALADLITEEMSVPSALLENVAGRIVKRIQREFPKTESIRLDIRKSAPPMSQDTDGCGVVIEV